MSGDRTLLRIDLPIAVKWRSGGSGDERGLELRIGRRRLTLRTRMSFEHASAWDPDAGRPFWRLRERGGLYDQSKLPLPGNLILDLIEQRMDYAEAVGFTLPMDWILDEFDASFDALAVATLKYHMDWSVCACSDDRRARYQGLIDRLLEPTPNPDADELEVLSAVHANSSADDLFGVDSSTPELRAAYDAVSARMETRREEWEARILAARHDFIDITRELWS